MREMRLTKILVEGITEQLGIPEEAEKYTPFKLLCLMDFAEQFSTTEPTRHDRRFPNQNQTQNCWTAVNEYQYCVKKTGDHANPHCAQRYRDMATVCPASWLDTYQEQIEDGTFMGIGGPLGPEDDDEDEDDDDDE